jgi:hypothetical protein
MACAIRLPLLSTYRCDLDLDGQDHYDPKQEATMVLHRFLLLLDGVEDHPRRRRRF